jgi:hypothetical protein
MLIHHYVTCMVRQFPVFNIRGNREALPHFVYFVIRRHEINVSSPFLQKKSLFVTMNWDVSQWKTLGAVLYGQFLFLLSLTSFRHDSISTQGNADPTNFY